MEFEEYRNRYRYMEMTRDDRGILEIRLHTDGGPLRWGHLEGPHAEFASAFGEIASDAENRVIILTGTGDSFSGPVASQESFPRGDGRVWDLIRRNGMRLTMGLLDIDAPIISCVNGPAVRHPEIPLLADIVLAADDASFQDSAHFVNRTLCGDGMNVVMPLLMGYNRGRYFLYTGQVIDAQQAHELGLVAELMPREQLLPRARELAETLIQQNPLVLRYQRMLFTQPLKKMMHDVLGYGLALETIAAVDESTGNVGFRWND